MTPKGDFENILPPAITAKATPSPAGNELVIPLPEMNQTIHLASDHLIAVLGVESFQILEDGIGLRNYTGYRFECDGDWAAYVSQNNEAALRFIHENPVGQGHGYILTAVSEDEFKALKPSKQSAEQRP
jgi:hypothetical protein